MLLNEIKGLRKEAQEQYFDKIQEIWLSDLNVAKKDSKARKEYNLYRDKDRFLERLEAMQESILEDLDFYHNKYKYK